MSNETLILSVLITLPAVFSIISLFLPTPRSVLLLCASGTVLVALAMGTLALAVLGGSPVFGSNGWLRVDALSAFHLTVLGIVYALGALQTPGYFRDEIEDGSLNLSSARRYGALWFGSLGAMLIVLLSNNMGLMWVGIEATTLLTAFLICVHATPGSLEAMWKYLLMCSVGVALAFTGTLLAAASTGPSAVHGTESLLWTSLMANAASLDVMLIKAGFIFMVIGYGTKAGLAPMHSWLPDAHSQAPAPVSAVFSGFLLNAALYCIFRCLPIVETATGNTGWGRGILVAAGLLSILTAASFIAVQRDIKRMLAYSSLEHIGIIALGAGLGGVAAFAAMFHMLSHSIGKSTAFMCAGRLMKAYKTNDMRKITGTLASSPLWGAGFLASLLALIGTAPFAIFFTEFMILRTAVNAGDYLIATAFLAGLSVVFIGVMRYAIPIAWKPSESAPVFPAASPLEYLLVIVPLSVLLALGVWMPPFLTRTLASAAGLLGGTM